jgi:hypothetical protein
MQMFVVIGPEIVNFMQKWQTDRKNWVKSKWKIPSQHGTNTENR